MKRRTAATLVEVLVAIFVTAVGLIALLTLFPLGALQMAQAIRDGRTSQLAANATALAEAGGIRNPTNLQPVLSGIDPFLDPDGPAGPVPPAVPPVAQTWQGPVPLRLPSYPVYCDSVGVNSFPVGRGRFNVANRPFFARRSLGLIEGLPPGPARLRKALEWHTLLDDVAFDESGLSKAPMTREGRYSCAYLLRRPSADDPQVVDMAVVVYADRPLQMGQQNAASANTAAGTTPLGEDFYPANGGPAGGTRLVIVANAAGQLPPIRRGGWILDVSQEKVELMTQSGTITQGTARGYFYRVVDYIDQGTVLEVELQTPLRQTIDSQSVATAVVGGSIRRTIFPEVLFLENVVEVFEKGTRRLP